MLGSHDVILHNDTQTLQILLFVAVVIFIHKLQMRYTVFVKFAQIACVICGKLEQYLSDV